MGIGHLESIVPGGGTCIASQDSAETAITSPCLVSTDPPYYDNVGYADLSDFFYVWLRRSLGEIYPELLGTMLTPKIGGACRRPVQIRRRYERAEKHFETGFVRVFAPPRPRRFRIPR